MRHIKDPNCSFCGADIEATVFAEQGDFRAIYNRAPILPGHSLVIPVWHAPSLLDLTDAEVGQMVVFSRLVVRNLLRIFNAEGLNWTIQEGAVAGQTVPHLHLHLIPRNNGDLPTPGDWYPRLQKSEERTIDSDERPRYSVAEVQRIAEHIRALSPRLSLRKQLRLQGGRVERPGFVARLCCDDRLCVKSAFGKVGNVGIDFPISPWRGVYAVFATHGTPCRPSATTHRPRRQRRSRCCRSPLPAS
jgi:bis(5'-adenosyl)-triphosphatase